MAPENSEGTAPKDFEYIRLKANSGTMHQMHHNIFSVVFNVEVLYK